MKQRITYILVPAMIFLAASCAPVDAPEQDAPVAEGVLREIERGPARMILRLDRESLTMAEQLNLEIEVAAEEGYEVQLPRFGEQLDQFGIVDYSDPPQELSGDGRVRHRRTYVLEPFLSGDYSIPPMTAGFWKADEEERHEITSEALTVTVTSILPEDFGELHIQDIAAPVALPAPVKPWQWGVIVAVVLSVAGFVVGWFWWRRKSAAEEDVVIPPHEWAFGALEALLAQNLIDEGKTKAFYAGISDILRQFLERRFLLHAPEQTTEEFLRDPETGRTLPTESKRILGAFLQHCDMVKFAEHRPATEDIQGAFDTCKQFVLDTPPKTASVEGGAA
jgi:hypothetical protein